MNKKEFRLKYKELRKELSEDEIEEKSLEIANNALKLSIWEKTNYHIFLPISEKKEVNTEYLLHILQGKDKSIIVSRSNFKTFEMTHILLQENTVLKESVFRIPEPVSGIEILPKHIDVVFIPLLAFDQKGNRLGYGKGFYDRFMKECSPETIFVGLSFFEAEDKIPSEENDIALHFCVTPKNNYSF